MEKDWRDYKQMKGGEEAARKEFQKDCAFLVNKMYSNEDVQTVDDEMGDEGIDILVGKIGIEPITIFQCKFFLEKFDEGQKGQIRKSFKRSAENKNYKLREWILCIPRKLNVEQLKWWNNWKRKNETVQIRITLMNGEELIHLMKLHEIYKTIFKIEDTRKIDELHKFYEQQHKVEKNRLMPKLSSLGSESSGESWSFKFSNLGEPFELIGVELIHSEFIFIDYPRQFPITIDNRKPFKVSGRTVNSSYPASTVPFELNLIISVLGQDYSINIEKKG